MIGGSLSNGRFESKAGGLVVGPFAPAEDVILGVRPEDCTVSEAADGDLSGRIYSVELIGDHTLVTVATAAGQVTLKADKAYNRTFDDAVGVKIESRGVYLFDEKSGARLRA
jgi:multiple sugar transport system ATP-binding protein